MSMLTLEKNLKFELWGNEYKLVSGGFYAFSQPNVSCFFLICPWYPTDLSAGKDLNARHSFFYSIKKISAIAIS